MDNQYRKKPVVIEAVQFTEAMREANIFDGGPLPEGVTRGRANYHPGRRQVYDASYYVETMEGRMAVSLGDWIIKGVKGEFYPCKPDIFEATYERASNPASPANHDEISLATMRKIVALPPAKAFIGGAEQRNAQIQCLINDALAEAGIPASPAPVAVAASDELTDADLLRRTATEAAEYLEAVAGKTSRNSVWERCTDLANELRRALSAAPQAQAVPVAPMMELRARVKEMQEATYTYGDHSKEAVSAALDGVLDEIDEMAATPPAAAAAPSVQEAAARDVLAERRRQVDAEGWAPEHDDGYTDGELAKAAAAYTLNTATEDGPHYWPWPLVWWKPTDARRDLVKAGALILAEIERLDRAAAPSTAATDKEG